MSDKAVKKTILVTGGAGFIGSNLIQELQKRYPDSKILSLDNYFAGSKDNHIKGVTYIEGDTKNIKILIQENIDLLFHLGEYSRVEASFDDIEKVIDFNKVGTASVVNFCKEQPSCKLIYAASSTKFADNGEGRDQSPYAFTKAINVDLINNYGLWFSLNYAIVYFYNVYGERERSEGPYATLIGIFKKHFLQKTPLPVVAPGTQKRNFTHVNDIVNGIILAAEKGKGDGYQLGAKESYSVLEIANMFGGDITLLPERRGNRMFGVLDTTKAERELGWKATQKIKDYIEEIKK
ncbi:MAG: hypothetical protein RI935_737 [Candidatus Parcubacteria bacterium]|jgi:UDP-glucose 4-epimerase